MGSSALLPGPLPSEISPADAFALLEESWISEEGIVDLGVKWLQDGMDGQALRELAGLSRMESGQANSLLMRVLDESGSSIPSPADAVCRLVQIAARQCLAGEWDTVRVQRALESFNSEASDSLPLEIQVALSTADDLGFSVHSIGPLRAEFDDQVNALCRTIVSVDASSASDAES